MPKKILEKLIEEDKDCCCPFGFFYSRRAWNTAKLSRATGLTKRAIRYWKRKVKLGKVVCHNGCGGNCNRTHPPHIEFIPVARRSSLHKPLPEDSSPADLEKSPESLP